MPPLANPRREKFAQHVATGESATAAYRLVYAKAKNADVMGPRLLGNVGVRARVAELQSRSAIAATLTMRQRREIACAIATDSTARASDRLAAIMADARLAGELKGDSLTVSATASANGYVLTEEHRAELMERRREALEGMADERRAELMAKMQVSIARREAAMAERETAGNGAN